MKESIPNIEHAAAKVVLSGQSLEPREIVLLAEKYGRRWSELLDSEIQLTINSQSEGE